ncbi:MAG: FAD:protein FMN transferase [Clostridiales bacterium]|nr:FAD:protein FMN transferase [Clostridiales bacterium]
MIYKTSKNPKIFLFFIMMTLFFTSCGNKEPKLINEKQFVLGTLGEINIYSISEEKGREAINKAYERINEIEHLMSATIETSEIYKLNENAGIKPVEVSDETLKVIEYGLNYYPLTEENFNIGLGALSKLWGINITNEQQPSDIPTLEEINNIKSHISIENIEINNNEVFIKDENMQIDLGGIAKGYAVDEAVKILRDHGIDSGFINLGGDIYVLDKKPIDNSPWRMGIQRPEIGSTDAIAMVELFNSSIVTSGNYQRYLEHNPEYHHILDPKTGYPANNELVSVTIISDSSVEGDILSTTAFIMGLDKGMSFISNYANAEGVFITKDKKVYITDGMKDIFHLLDDEYTLVQ